MSRTLQAVSVRGLTTALSAATVALESAGIQAIVSLSTSNATVTPLTASPTQLFVRADRNDKRKRIRVFNNAGVQVYSIERLSAYNPVWSMFTFPSRREVATISVGVMSRSVSFHNQQGVANRAISGWCGAQAFFLADGARYEWARGSKFLEKVINPGGGVEETRLRIARARLLRQFRIDYELLVDESHVSVEAALATSFVSILTQWGVGESTSTVGPTYVVPKTVDVKEEKRQEVGESPVVVVIGDGTVDVETVEVV